MKSDEIREKYINYFVSKKHAKLESSSLIPENDSSVLFITAGMQPLIPYLAGEKHQKGNRLVCIQRCLRTNDIDEVGDRTHLTFFEMMGNWSLGDYFKKESIGMSYEFLTKELNIPVENLAVTLFQGNDVVEKDMESYKAWRDLGIPDDRIAFLGEEDNWWPNMKIKGLCGPDTEIFYWTGEGKAPAKFDPSNDYWVEIWNNVFMQYFNEGDGKLRELEKKNVDTGMGLERMLVVLNDVETVFDTDLFEDSIKKIEEMTGKKYKNEDGTENEYTRDFRIICDHLRAAVFLLAEGVVPSNVDQGYILRRFIRRSIRNFKKLGLDKPKLEELAQVILEKYKKEIAEIGGDKNTIIDELKKEETTFSRTLDKGIKEVEKAIKQVEEKYEEIKKEKGIEIKKVLKGDIAFRLYDTYGFPLELTEEIAKERGIEIDKKGFEKQQEKHKEESKKGSENKFAGGLLNHDENTVRLHTATHLLHQSLRNVLGDTVLQKGSNITPERLRFDFSFDRKLTDEEIKEVEDLVNKAIEDELEVTKKEMSVKDAKEQGAIGIFTDKYDDIIKVYSIGDYSKEICGGPHVKNTKELGHFKITKEQSSSKGVRRIKAILDK